MIHTGGSRDSHLRPMNGRRWPVVVNPPKNKSHYEVCHRNRWRYCTSFHDNIGGMGTCLSFTVRAESVEILGCLRRLAVLAWRLVLFRVKFRPGPAWFLTRCVTTELPSTDANPRGKSTVGCKTHERRALTISVRPGRGGTGGKGRGRVPLYMRDEVAYEIWLLVLVRQRVLVGSGGDGSVGGRGGGGCRIGGGTTRKGGAGRRMPPVGVGAGASTTSSGFGGRGRSLVRDWGGGVELATVVTEGAGWRRRRLGCGWWCGGPAWPVSAEGVEGSLLGSCVCGRRRCW